MIFAVRGDDIFEAEHLPSYARTYILPRQMVRMLEYSLNDDNTFIDFSFVKLPKRRKMPMVIQLSVSPSQVCNFYLTKNSRCYVKIISPLIIVLPTKLEKWELSVLMVILSYCDVVLTEQAGIQPP